MTEYPIKVTAQSFNHSGGTKSYHLMLIRTVTGKCVIVRRWGRVGQFGQLKAEHYNTVSSAMEAFESLLDERRRKGYSTAGLSVKREAKTQNDLVSAITLPVFSKLGPKTINHLDPTYDTSRMHEPDEPTLDEDTLRKVRQPTARGISQEDYEEMVRRQEAERLAVERNHYESIPEFGMF